MNGLVLVAILTILIVLYNLYNGYIIYNHPSAVLPGTAKQNVRKNQYKYILDVRMKEAWEYNHFPEAISIPLHQISSETLAQHSIRPEDSILIYSNSNVCAKRAYTKLKKLSYEKVSFLLGTYTNLL